MPTVDAEAPPSAGSPFAIGVSTPVSTELSVAIYRFDGEWPLGLGGLGASVLAGTLRVVSTLWTDDGLQGRQAADGTVLDRQHASERNSATRLPIRSCWPTKR